MRLKLAKCSKRALALLGIALLLCGTYASAQNLGSAPETNVALQGETGAQPEGAFLNFMAPERPGGEGEDVAPEKRRTTICC